MKYGDKLEHLKYYYGEEIVEKIRGSDNLNIIEDMYNFKLELYAGKSFARAKKGYFVEE